MNQKRQESAFPKVHSTKAAVLIIIGLVIGLVILNKGAATPVSIASSTSATTQVSAPAGGGSSTTAAPSTTLAGLHPAAAVSILVANGTGTQGAATRVANQLPLLEGSGGSYKDVLSPSVNVPVTANPPPSVVYYVPGYQADAQAIAHALGLLPKAAMALPTPSPVTYSKPYDILIVIGPDLAGAPSGAGTTTTTSATTAHD